MAKGATEPLDELARLVALQVKLQIGNQAETIEELSKIGIGPSRIAEMLGTTAGTVNVALARSKKKPRKPKASG